jgi:Na+/phosphate symporter
MDTTLTLVDLGGAIALLIWGVHMVQTGITRAFGPQLRRMLSYALGNRFKAFLAGVGVTSILQSSTATGLMVTAFAAGGLVDLVPALAVMLGANVGTTLIVQVLSFDVSRVSFLFILIGVFVFRRSGVTRTRDLGRVGIGLGLMLIALQHLLSMIIPFEDVPSLRMLLGAVTTDPLIDILLAAGLTWAAHSSVAVVLLIMAFASCATSSGSTLIWQRLPIRSSRGAGSCCRAGSSKTCEWRGGCGACGEKRTGRCRLAPGTGPIGERAMPRRPRAPRSRTASSGSDSLRSSPSRCRRTGARGY